MFINEINYLVAEAKRAFEQMHFREASMFTFSLLINARNKYRQECQALGEVRCRMDRVGGARLFSCSTQLTNAVIHC